jgi:hypothetical protein
LKIKRKIGKKTIGCKWNEWEKKYTRNYRGTSRIRKKAFKGMTRVINVFGAHYIMD